MTLLRWKSTPSEPTLAELPPRREEDLRSGARPAGGELLSVRLERIGLCWSGEGTPGPADPFWGSGKYVAAAAWTEALARHGRVPSIEIFAPLSRIEACRRQLDGLPDHLFGEPAAVAQLFGEADLLARCEAEAFDVLHSPMGIDLTTAGYLRSRCSGPIFPATCSQHGISYSFLLNSMFIPLLTAPIYPCDAIVCSTDASQWAMEKRLADVAERYSRAWDRPPPLLPRLERIPWGVDTEFFSPQDPAAARRTLHLPPDRPIVLCVGRMRIQDKMDWTPLLLAFQDVEQTVKEWPLLILAGAADLEYGERLIEQAAHLGLRDSVRTFFNLPPALLPTLYAACDVFVSPADSPSESFGLTLIEAMACGRPVVASDWDGYKELIVHGETGFKVRTDWVDCLGELDQAAPLLSGDQQHLHVGQSVSFDVAQMAGYLRLLLKNRELREEMGRRGRARVEALYDWPAVIAQWEALWAELAAIARSLEGKASDRLEYLQPHYFEHFSHYASRILDDATPVGLTPRGREQLARQRPLLLHPWARGFLSPHYLQAGLGALKPAQWLGASLPLGKLVEILNKRHGLSRDRALMHLMWLAKYDLLRFGANDSGHGGGTDEDLRC